MIGEAQACLGCGTEFATNSPSHKFCSKSCRRRAERARLLCKVENCTQRRKGAGFCGTHYYRFRKYGSPMADVVRVCRPRKSGGRVVRKDGYVTLSLPGNPYVTCINGTIAEHRFVMSEHMGRPLRADETVHHKNGVRDDNRIENLELRLGAHGQGQAVEDRVADARRVLEQYAPHLLAA